MMARAKRGFARAEVARKRDEIAGLQRRGDINAQNAGSRPRRAGRYPSPKSYAAYSEASIKLHYSAASRAAAGGGPEIYRSRWYHVRARNRWKHCRHAAPSASARSKGPGPRRDGVEPRVVALEQVEYPLLDVLGDAGALVGDPKTLISFARFRRSSVTVSPAGENPIALDIRLNRICRTRFPSAMKRPILAGTRISSFSERSESRSRMPSAAASIVARNRLLEFQRHRAGVDGREIQNVVDDGEQRRARIR